MTAFQKLVEMPLTGRSDSYARASFAQKLLPVDIDADSDRVKAVAVTFAAVDTGDLLTNTRLGLYEPGKWTTKDWAVVDEYAQAAVTGAVFDRVLTPAAQR